MANRTVYILDENTGMLIPVRYVDNEDGTYSRAVVTGNETGETVIHYTIRDNNAGDTLPIRYIDNGDGTYSIKYAASSVEVVTEIGIQDTAGIFILDTAGKYILDTTGV